MINGTGESEFSVSIGVLTQLVGYLLYLKVDIDKFLLSVGVDPSILTSPDERILVEKYTLVEEEAAHVTNDPCFGLHMGQFIEAGNWSILGYMMMNCKTLGEAFGKFAKYSNIIGNLIYGDVHMGPDSVTIFLAIPQHAPIISRHCYEGYFSSMICLARTLSGKNVNPIEVGFAFQEPECLDEYNKIFGSPVLFRQNQNYIIMDIKVAEIPVLLPNENLLQYFENYAKEFLTEVDAVHNVTYKVKKRILSHMDNEKLSIKIIAKELSMSVRTLQIYLKREGTEFSRLLKETREQLATKYLRENYTVEDIAYLLGFSDSCAFRKAFKKWVGVTPKEYRENFLSIG
jgi:AraC-like DNA-binding protein